MLRTNSTSTRRAAALTFTLAAVAGAACGGTTTPEPPDGWQEQACGLGLASGPACDAVAMAGAGGMGGGGPMPMAGSGGMPPADVCDAVTTVFQNADNGCDGAGCHGASSGVGSFAVDDPMMFVGRSSILAGDSCLYINPDNIEASIIYTRAVGGTPECGPDTMPAGRSRLDQTQQDCLLDWLSQFSNEPGAVASGGAGGGGGGGGGPDEPAACDAPALVLQLSGPEGGCGSAGCHGTGSGNGAFAEDDPMSFVDVPTRTGSGCMYIDSSDAEASAIYDSLTGNAGSCGIIPMPLGGSAPDAQQQACILSWLRQFEQ